MQVGHYHILVHIWFEGQRVKDKVTTVNKIKTSGWLPLNEGHSCYLGVRCCFSLFFHITVVRMAFTPRQWPGKVGKVCSHFLQELRTIVHVVPTVMVCLSLQMIVVNTAMTGLTRHWKRLAHTLRSKLFNGKSLHLFLISVFLHCRA